jgi:thioredoxin reductase
VPRTALLCDEGQQRNLSSPAIHGLLGREGRSPAAFLGEARQELTRYNSVSVRGTRVTDIVSVGGSFEFSCADGTTGGASKILLATGLVDDFLNSLASNLSTAFQSTIVFIAML